MSEPVLPERDPAVEVGAEGDGDDFDAAGTAALRERPETDISLDTVRKPSLLRLPAVPLPALDPLVFTLRFTSD